MKKKRRIINILIAVAFLSVTISCLAETVTLRTVSTFAGTDAGPEYVDLLHAWEATTGNHVDDRSAASDETWKAEMLNDFAAGNESDVFFFFAATADSKPLLGRVIPISQINAAYPDLDLVESAGLREEDGLVYAIDVRPFWEGLFVNTDLFERYSLELPTDRDKFEKAVQVFRRNGIVPLAISLSDIPHYIVEFSILASGSTKDHQARPADVSAIPDSWVRGMQLIRHLYQIGAFPDNVNATSEVLTTSMFINKQAAMLLDGSWRANGVAQENWDTTIVLPFPPYNEEADPSAIIGGTSMGFYISKRAWDDEEKRDAAVSLLAHLTSDEARARLGFTFGGEMLKSAITLTGTAAENGSLAFPIGDVMDSGARSFWFSQIPAIADGTADIRDVLEETIKRGAFSR